VGEMGVVVVERVRGGAVGERRGARRNQFVQSRDGSHLLAAFLGDEPANDFGDGLVLARPRHREPVVERQARRRAGGGGDRLGRNGRDVQEAVQRAGHEHCVSSSVVFWQPGSALRLCDLTTTSSRSVVGRAMSSVLSAEDFLDVVCAKMATDLLTPRP
jgi:hypothetical protein